jgi:hypothetical protein
VCQPRKSTVGGRKIRWKLLMGWSCSVRKLEDPAPFLTHTHCHKRQSSRKKLETRLTSPAVARRHSLRWQYELQCFPFSCRTSYTEFTSMHAKAEKKNRASPALNILAIAAVRWTHEDLMAWDGIHGRTAIRRIHHSTSMP